MDTTTTTTPTPSTSSTTSSSTASPDSWANVENMITLGLSFFLLTGTIVWLCIWFRRQQKLKMFKRKSKDPDKANTKSPKSDRKDDLPQLPKTPSVASIQSTGSNYYDQLMGSGNIPKVKSISQYGALLAQQEPPPP